MLTCAVKYEFQLALEHPGSAGNLPRGLMMHVCPNVSLSGNTAITVSARTWKLSSCLTTNLPTRSVSSIPAPLHNFPLEYKLGHTPSVALTSALGDTRKVSQLSSAFLPSEQALRDLSSTLPMLRVLCLYMNKIQNLEAALTDMRRLPKVMWLVV